MARRARKPEQTIAQANELARKFYASHGYRATKGYRFDQATHPQEAGMWNLAAIAYEALLDTDLEAVLSEVEE